MYGYNAVLAALRAHAHQMIGSARSRLDQARLRRDYGDCILRNRAKLLVMRLNQTSNDAARRQILRKALFGA
jgi:hypothetical protein